ncbi:polysaccharide pyruvyl transferase family protein [Streptomyces sp. NPDC006923]|uniref:polysaccharide pyruvyl transferase family protein n=1 Tax=Streptomyces sp. NPDC006923 TaxID=3155355 RepID=UPI0033D4A3AB
MTAVPLPGDRAAAREAASPAPANALTGKRRIAFAAFVDDDRVPGFLALLRSLALSNPDVCEDFVVLHDGLSAGALARIGELHPRVEPRPVATERYAAYALDASSRRDCFLLDVFRIREYDTVITLDPDTVVLGDLGALLRLRDGLAACGLPSGGPGGRRRIAPGPLVVQREYLTDAFCARLDAAGRDGAYGHGAGSGPGLGLLDAVLDGDFVPLDGMAEYSGTEQDREKFDLPDAEFHAAYMALSSAAHHDLIVRYGTPHVLRTEDLESARKVATAHIVAGEYQEAADLLGRIHIPVNEAWPHEVFGHALMSLSRYDEARAQLLMATAAPKRAATAFGRLAQIAWIHGDDGAAREYALAGLSTDPTHQAAREMRRRTTGLPTSRQGPAEDQLAHVAFYMPQQGNAGDKLLPESVRLTFGADTGSRRWHSVHAHRLFDEAALEAVNARRGLVIGGGGLFIPDTAPNGNSGWQWNVSDAMLNRIDVPIMVYAVGFNAFDGQSYRRRRFEAGLRLLVERAAFFGLRNHGSIEKVRALLPASLHDKVRFQPCPTTVTRQLVDGWTDPEHRENTVMINAAYDRAGLRFGHDYGHFLGEMAKAVRALDSHAEVQCVAHSLDDERIAFDLRREYGISLPVIPMYDFGNDAIRDTYARTKLVIGMRGHAGMIPFGCGTPVISLISHPKMAYFLSDIERPEWGVSVHDKNLGALLTERALGVLNDHDAAVADVHGRQRELWKVTRANAADLAAVLGTPAG